MAGWVGVEIEVNANSAPNWVGVGAGAELGKKKPKIFFEGEFLCSFSCVTTMNLSVYYITY